MEDTSTDDDISLRYPIGPFTAQELISPVERDRLIYRIGIFPRFLREVVEWLDDEALRKRYRPGSWTIRQIVHHIADSHLNSYVRFKLAVTEELPIVTSYDENKWAELADAICHDLRPSLLSLEGLHDRWCGFLYGLDDEDFQRAFIHPIQGRTTVLSSLQYYAWHGEHHLAHITNALQREQ